MKSLAVVWVVALLVGVGMWFTAEVLAVRHQLNGHVLSEKLKEVHGLSRREVVSLLGEPYKVMTGRAYDNRERGDIAISYEPDPPTAAAAEAVLLYRDGLRLAALFFRDGKVAQVWEGLT